MSESAFGIEHGVEISKAERKQPKASAGRLAAGTAFGPYHGVVAGKKGKKLRAAGNQFGGTLAGGVDGSVAGSIVGRGNPTVTGLAANAGALTGAYKGTKAAQRKGYFKKEQ